MNNITMKNNSKTCFIRFLCGVSILFLMGFQGCDSKKASSLPPRVKWEEAVVGKDFNLLSESLEKELLLHIVKLNNVPSERLEIRLISKYDEECQKIGTVEFPKYFNDGSESSFYVAVCPLTYSNSLKVIVIGSNGKSYYKQVNLPEGMSIVGSSRRESNLEDMQYKIVSVLRGPGSADRNHSPLQLVFVDPCVPSQPIPPSNSPPKPSVGQEKPSEPKP